MKSLEDIPEWLQEVSKYIPEDTYKILLVNKSDVAEEEKVINQEIMLKFYEETGIPVLETSAKTGTNVDEAFIIITKELLKKKSEERSKPSTKIGAGNMLSYESIILKCFPSVIKILILIFL